MGESKIKISYGSLNIEVEGDGELIYRIFSDVKNSGSFAQSVLSSANESKASEKAVQPLEDVMASAMDTPLTESFSDINSLVLEKRIFSQSNWMLLLAWFASHKGNLEFTRKDIQRSYNKMSKYTKMKSKDFTTNLVSLMFKDYVSMVNKNVFVLTETGINKSIELLKAS